MVGKAGGRAIPRSALSGARVPERGASRVARPGASRVARLGVSQRGTARGTALRIVPAQRVLSVGLSVLNRVISAAKHAQCTGPYLW